MLQLYDVKTIDDTKSIIIIILVDIKEIKITVRRQRGDYYGNHA